MTFWRGVACLLIVVYHSVQYQPGENFVFWLLHQCWIGVPVFFVISGYCITASADALRKNPLPVRRFFWRRIRRIFPPYWVWLGLMAILVYWVETSIAPGYFQSMQVPSVLAMTKWRWLGNITLTEMWRTHVTGESPTQLFWGPSWTLCYEEQFYVVVGLILLCARRFFFTAATVISVAVIAGSILVPGYDLRTSGTFVNCLWLAFGAGVLAYYALNYVRPERRDWYCMPLIVGIACIVFDRRQAIYLDGKWVIALCGIAAYYIWRRGPRWRYLSFAPLVLGFAYAFVMRSSVFHVVPSETSEQCVAAFLFAFLIIPLKKWDDSINRSKVLSPFRFCGEMCYSLYLVHWPLVVVIGKILNSFGLTSPAAVLFIILPCCVAIAVLVAWVFHRLVERRFWNPRI
ncbi:MAG TPA: acyltransferase [Verrucomicrobiae bacterium]|nr:acyltransferase [Verrucomicrobiae bacterium]